MIMQFIKINSLSLGLSKRVQRLTKLPKMNSPFLSKMKAINLN